MIKYFIFIFSVSLTGNLFAGELYNAAQKGDVDAVKELVKQQPDSINERGRFLHDTPLQVAAFSGFDSVVAVLLAHGANPNLADMNDRTPILFAAQKGFKNIVSMLVNAHANLDAADKDSLVPLVVARSMDIVKMLVEHGANVHVKPQFYWSLEKLKYLESKGTDTKQLIADKSALVSLCSWAHRPNPGQDSPFEDGVDPTDMIRYLLDKGADANGQDAHGQVPLIRALQNGDSLVAALLIASRVSVNEADNSGQTPLLAVLQSRRESISGLVNMLLAHGADVNVSDRGYRSALLMAVGRGDTTMVSAFLERGAILNPTEKKEYCPLVAAMWPSGYLEPPHTDSVRAALDRRSAVMVEFLIRHGADPKANLNGVVDEPLVNEAINADRVNVASVMLAHGASASYRDKDSASLIFKVVPSAHCGEMIALLKKYGVGINAKDIHGQTALHAAALEGKSLSIAGLIAQGANVNARDDSGQTPLHYLEMWRSVYRNNGTADSIEQMFITHGADTSARDNNGYSAHVLRIQSMLYVAATDGDTDQVRTILATKQAPVNLLVGRQQLNPLHEAVLKGHTRVTEMLLSNGANANIPDGRGNTPMILTFKGFRRYGMPGYLTKVKRDAGGSASGDSKSPQAEAMLAIAELLLKHGANVNTANTAGDTPMHEAASMFNVEGARFLIDHGADVNAKDNKGQTPLHWLVGAYSMPANQSDREETLKLLLAHGADTKAQDRNMHTAADMAKDVKLKAMLGK